MAERTPQALADVFEKHLGEKYVAGKRSPGPTNLKCESTVEAAQLAAEMKRRGWKAAPTKAINISNSEVWSGVRVTGRKKGGSHG